MKDFFIEGILPQINMDSFFDLIIKYSIKMAAAIVMLIVGFWVSNKMTKAFKKILNSRNAEVSVSTFLTSFVNILFKILIVVVAVASAGIEMTSIAAILGAGSLAIGMALSGTLQNFAGGIVILFLRPFKVADYIEAQGFAGIVHEIAIFTTLIKTYDNKSIFIPNGILANGSIINYTKDGIRRVDAVYGISYGNDVDVARKVLKEIIASDSRIHKKPEPMIFLTALADSSVNLSVRVWTNADNFFLVHFDMNEKVYKKFPQAGLQFPFPQLQIHTTEK